MAEAQRDLLLALDLRVEGMGKIAALVPAALGGKSKQAAPQIAGDMEIFLASDVIYSQRVAPLIQQTLTANGIQGLSTRATRFLPNVGWLEPSTVAGAAHRPGLGHPQGPQTVHRQPRQRAEGGERRHEHARTRTDAQPHQRRRQPDVHGARSKTRANSPRRTSRSTSP